MNVRPFPRARDILREGVIAPFGQKARRRRNDESPAPHDYSNTSASRRSVSGFNDAVYLRGLTLFSRRSSEEC